MLKSINSRPSTRPFDMTITNGPRAEDPEKRLAILEQAIRTFAEFGFRGTDVQVIAERAGVGKGTVYRYFGAKEELFWATTFEVLLRLERHLMAAMENIEGARNKLWAASMAYANFFENNPQCLEVFVQDRAEFRGVAPQSRREHHEKLNTRFADIIAQGIAAGEFRPVEPDRTVMALGALLHGCVVLSCYVRHRQSLTELTTQAMDIFFAGIRAVGAT